MEKAFADKCKEVESKKHLLPNSATSDPQNVHHISSNFDSLSAIFTLE